MLRREARERHMLHHRVTLEASCLEEYRRPKICDVIYMSIPRGGIIGNFLRENRREHVIIAYARVERSRNGSDFGLGENRSGDGICHDVLATMRGKTIITPINPQKIMLNSDLNTPPSCSVGIFRRESIIVPGRRKRVARALRNFMTCLSMHLIRILFAY